MCRIKTPRLARRVASWFDAPAAAPEDVSAVSAVVSLYREWWIAGRELERLSRALTQRRFPEGLRSLEQGCTSIRITRGLVELVEREYTAGPAGQLRRDLLAEIRPWLEAARRELPAAATHLCTLGADAAGRDRVIAALRQLDEELAVEQSAPTRRMES